MSNLRYLEFHILLEALPHFLTTTLTYFIIKSSTPIIPYEYVFLCRGLTFAGCSIAYMCLSMIVEQTVYGRLYLFLGMWTVCFIWTPWIQFETTWVLYWCFHCLFVVKEPSRLGYVVQRIWLPTSKSNLSSIRTLFCALYFAGTLGAFVGLLMVGNMLKDVVLNVAAVLVLVYFVTTFCLGDFGATCIRYNLVSRGFGCFVTILKMKLEGRDKPDESDDLDEYDDVVVVGTRNLMMLSAFFFPAVLLFTTVEMIFCIWVANYQTFNSLDQLWYFSTQNLSLIAQIVATILCYLWIYPTLKLYCEVPDTICLAVGYLLIMMTWVTICLENYAAHTEFDANNTNMEVVMFSKADREVQIDNIWSQNISLNPGGVKIIPIPVASNQGAKTKTSSIVDIYEQSPTKPKYYQQVNITGETGSTTFFMVSNSSSNFTIVDVTDEDEDEYEEDSRTGRLLVSCSQELYTEKYDVVVQDDVNYTPDQVKPCGRSLVEFVLPASTYNIYISKWSILDTHVSTVTVHPLEIQYVYLAQKNQSDFYAEHQSIHSHPHNMAFIFAEVGIFALGGTMCWVSFHTLAAWLSQQELLGVGFAILYLAYGLSSALAGLIFYYFQITWSTLMWWLCAIITGLFFHLYVMMQFDGPYEISNTPEDSASTLTLVSVESTSEEATTLTSRTPSTTNATVEVSSSTENIKELDKQ